MRSHAPALLALALALAGCGPAPIQLVNSPAVPAAMGEIKTKEGENGNLKLRVEVKHLATPDKVQPGAKVFVVWVEKPGATPQNMGALQVDEDKSGQLETVTPHHRFNLVITAEEEATTDSPKGPRVLSAVVER